MKLTTGYDRTSHYCNLQQQGPPALPGMVGQPSMDLLRRPSLEMSGRLRSLAEGWGMGWGGGGGVACFEAFVIIMILSTKQCDSGLLYYVSCRHVTCLLRCPVISSSALVCTYDTDYIIALLPVVAVLLCVRLCIGRSLIFRACQYC